MPRGKIINSTVYKIITDTFNSMYELDSKVTVKEVQAKVNDILRDKNPNIDPEATIIDLSIFFSISSPPYFSRITYKLLYIISVDFSINPLIIL